MSPEQLSFVIGSIYGSVLALLLLGTSRRSRNRYRPPGGGYGAPRRRGSNPPPPNTKPQPPSGPPQPLAARLIRYWAWKDDQIRQAFTEGRTIRGNGNGVPATPKPQFPPGRVTDVHGRTIGYRSINYPDPSPDRRPTNPFNGERIPNQPPRNL